MGKTVELLDHLAELNAQRDLSSLDLVRAKEQAIPAEIKETLIAIDVEYNQKIDAIDELIGALEGQIKSAVLQGGGAIKSEHYQAVFVKGRITWDTKKLDGISILIPELSQAKSVGEPTVQIRRVGK